MVKVHHCARVLFDFHKNLSMGQNQKVVFDSDDDFEETARAAEFAVKADELQRAEMAALAGDDTTDLEEEDDMEPETVSISRGKEELVVMQQSRKMAIQRCVNACVTENHRVIDLVSKKFRNERERKRKIEFVK